MPLTTHDILYLSIALSVLVFTGFVCWFIFYATQILKSTSTIINEVRDRVLELSSMLGDITAKIERLYAMINSLSGLGDMIKGKIRSKASNIFSKTFAPKNTDRSYDDDLGDMWNDENEVPAEPVKKQTRRVVKNRA